MVYYSCRIPISVTHYYLSKLSICKWYTVHISICTHVYWLVHCYSRYWYHHYSCKCLAIPVFLCVDYFIRYMGLQDSQQRIFLQNISQNSNGGNLWSTWYKKLYTTTYKKVSSALTHYRQIRFKLKGSYLSTSTFNEKPGSLILAKHGFGFVELIKLIGELSGSLHFSLITGRSGSARFMRALSVTIH